jgi:hypothetical protein
MIWKRATRVNVVFEGLQFAGACEGFIDTFFGITTGI